MCSSSRTTHHCISFKIALKYLKNNLRRPFENFEFILLLYRLYYRITIESIQNYNIFSLFFEFQVTVLNLWSIGILITISLSELLFLITLVDIVLTTVELVISYTTMKNFPVCCSRPRSISLCDIFKRGYLIRVKLK